MKILKTDDIVMGKKYRDRVSGFTGVATGITKWISGCDTVILQPSVKDDGKYPENAQFDITRVDLVDEPAIELKAGKNGGPQSMASITR